MLDDALDSFRICSTPAFLPSSMVGDSTRVNLTRFTVSLLSTRRLRQSRNDVVIREILLAVARKQRSVRSFPVAK
jgi:hypothetical protein